MSANFEKHVSTRIALATLRRDLVRQQVLLDQMLIWEILPDCLKVAFTTYLVCSFVNTV